MKIIDDAGLRAVFAELDRRANLGLSPWSKADLASQLGIKKQAINIWTKVPAERVPAVSQLLGLKKSILRPDLYDTSDDGVAPLKRKGAGHDRSRAAR